MAAPRELSLLRELLSLAEAIAARGRPLCRALEVRVVRRDVAAFGVEGASLAPRLAQGALQVQLRALKDGRLAQAETESFSVEENIAALRRALSGGRPSALLRFGEGRHEPSLEGYDPAIAAFAEVPARLQELAVGLRAAARVALAAAPHAHAVDASLRVHTRALALATGEGSACSLDNWFVAEAQADRAASARLVLRAWPADPAPVIGLGAEVVRALAPQRLGPHPAGIAPGSALRVLLAPEVVERLLREVAEPAFLASRLALGQPVLPHGEPLVDPRLRLVDTAFDGTERLWQVDDELTPKSEVVLLDGGRLEGWVSARQSAQAAGVAETGNGLRQRPLGEEPDGALTDRLAGLDMSGGERTCEAQLQSAPVVIEVRALGELRLEDRARTGFRARVTDGRLHRDGQLVAQCEPDAWQLAGQVLPVGGSALLSEAEPSLERRFTGSARLPWLLSTLTLAP